MADFLNPYYPYEKVQTGYNGLHGSEEIPHKLLLYLMDMPDASGYVPIDDNTRPRVRLAKYLWHDGALPLTKSLPTPTEKRSLLFDGENPVLNTDEQKNAHPKGYRLFWQEFWGQQQTEAMTVLKCYMGRIIPNSPYKTVLGITFQILCNVNQEGTTRSDAYSRAFDIEQCIIESLHGVNIAGVGVVDYDRIAHGDSGSRPIADDTGTIVGRELKMSILWSDSTEQKPMTWN